MLEAEAAAGIVAMDAPVDLDQPPHTTNGTARTTFGRRCPGGPFTARCSRISSSALPLVCGRGFELADADSRLIEERTACCRPVEPARRRPEDSAVFGRDFFAGPVTPKSMGSPDSGFPSLANLPGGKRLAGVGFWLAFFLALTRVPSRGSAGSAAAVTLVVGGAAAGARAGDGVRLSDGKRRRDSQSRPNTCARVRQSLARA